MINTKDGWILEAIMELESTDDGCTDRAANAIMLLNTALKCESKENKKK